MDWKILLVFLILLACPIVMSWTMRHKPKSYDQQGMRDGEGTALPRPVSDPEGQLARLEDRQLAVERELAALKEGRQPGNDANSSEGHKWGG